VAVHPVPSSHRSPYRQDRSEAVFPIDPNLERPRGLALPILAGLLILAVPAVCWLGYCAFAAGNDRHAVPDAPAPLLTCIAFSPDGKSMAVTTDGMVHIRDIVTGEDQLALPAPWDVRGLAFSPDGKTLALAGAHGDIQFWNVITGHPRSILRAVKVPRAMMVRVLPSPDAAPPATAPPATAPPVAAPPEQ
jgi:hypothetical protein